MDVSGTQLRKSTMYNTTMATYIRSQGHRIQLSGAGVIHYIVISSVLCSACMTLSVADCEIL